MSWLSDFWEDTIDFFKEDLVDIIKDEVIDDLLKDTVKYARLKWQAKAVRAVNKNEEKAIATTINAIEKLVPGVNAAQLEQQLRRLYWEPLNYIKEATGADWLVDTPVID